MLSALHSAYITGQRAKPAPQDDLLALAAEVPHIPTDYLELAGESLDFTVYAKRDWINERVGKRYTIQNLPVLHLLYPRACLDSIRFLRENVYSYAYPDDKLEGDMIPLGDDRGDYVFFYMKFNDKTGLYLVDDSGVGIDEPLWLAPSLKDFLIHATGLDTFLRRAYHIDITI
jgi:hypothetical protein